MKLNFDPRLLTDIIGKGQYTLFRSVLSEYVANAWDAEAKKVEITLPELYSQKPIIIKDNGNGICDLAHFQTVGANIQIKNKVTEKFLRNIMGKKGIGRFAGFACSRRINYESYTGKEKISISLDRDELLKHTKLQEIEIPTQITSDDHDAGTIVTLDFLDQGYNIPSENQIIRDLILDFGLVSDFEIFVNEKKCVKQNIAGELIEIEESSDSFGRVKGNIILAKHKSKKLKSGVILRVNNRRVEGPTFWGLENDFSSKNLDRIYGDVNANDLEDIISSGREAFIQHEERYHELVKVLKAKILEVLDKIEAEHTTNMMEVIYNLPKFKQKISTLPPHLQEVCKKYVKKISPKIKRIKNDKNLLEIISLLILRASENSDMYTVLEKIEETENTDISTLANVLSYWGFGEIAHSSTLIQHRLKILNVFTQLVKNDDTLEYQQLHKILENNTWILDDKYWLFSSNEGLRTIVERLQAKYEGKKGRDRPDIILKRDRSDFILVELKAPKVIISMEDITQALEYRQEIQTNFPSARDIDIYVIGRQYDSLSRNTYFPGCPQKVWLFSWNEILQSTNDRLSWISRNLNEEYQMIISKLDEKEILARIG